MLVKSRGGTEVHTSPVPEAGKRLRGGGGGQRGVRGGTRGGEAGTAPGLQQALPGTPSPTSSAVHTHALPHALFQPNSLEKYPRL